MIQIMLISFSFYMQLFLIHINNLNSSFTCIHANRNNDSKMSEEKKYIQFPF